MMIEALHFGLGSVGQYAMMHPMPSELHTLTATEALALIRNDSLTVEHTQSHSGKGERGESMDLPWYDPHRYGVGLVLSPRQINSSF